MSSPKTPPETQVSATALDAALVKRCAECPSNNFTTKLKGGLILAVALLGIAVAVGNAWQTARVREIVREEFDKRLPPARYGEAKPSGVLIGQAQAEQR